MTGLTSNIEEVIQRFKIIEKELQTVDMSDALVVGVNAAKAKMQFRIFNKGLDAGNTEIGSYAGKKTAVSKTKFEGRDTEFLFGKTESKTVMLSAYERKRVAKGRQIKYKDLEFTGSLRRGMVVVKSSSTRVIAAIPNQRLYQIAKWQEEYIQAPIFALTTEERELLEKNITGAIKQIYARILNLNKAV